MIFILDDADIRRQIFLCFPDHVSLQRDKPQVLYTTRAGLNHQRAFLAFHEDTVGCTAVFGLCQDSMFVLPSKDHRTIQIDAIVSPLRDHLHCVRHAIESGHKMQVVYTQIPKSSSVIRRIKYIRYLTIQIRLIPGRVLGKAAADHPWLPNLFQIRFQQSVIGCVERRDGFKNPPPVFFRRFKQVDCLLPGGSERLFADHIVTCL